MLLQEEGKKVKVGQGEPAAKGLDRPFFSLIHFNWEFALYLALILIAAGMRFWDLGSRAMHHDESLHVLYSWYLYKGNGYVHDPMMHGPFQFHFNTLIYFLFGVSDYTARITYALFGTALVVTPYFLRKHLGRAGALVCAALLTFSPSMLYYSRFARNDIIIAVWTMILVIAGWRYVDERKPFYLYLGAAALSLSFATKETTYITVAIFGSFLALVIAVGGILLALGIVGQLLVNAFRPGQGLEQPAPSSPDERWSAEAKLGSWVSRLGLGSWVSRLGQGWVSAAGLGVLLGTLSVPQGSAFARVVWQWFGWIPTGQVNILGNRILTEHFVAGIVVALLIVLSGVVGFACFNRRWLIAAAVFYAIYVLLYTTVFTNPNGFGSGIWGSLDYWLTQQGVKRGGQPVYYFFILLPIYEFLPVAFGLAAAVYYAIRRNFFAFFLFYWAAVAMIAYSAAGEKMPWLVLNLALPFILLAGKFIGEIIERVDWRAFLQRGGPYFILVVAASLFAVVVVTAYFARASATTTNTLRLGFFVVLLAALIGYAYSRGKIVGWGLAIRSLALVVAGIMLLFTIRAAWQASYYHGDIPVEMLIYTQSSPSIPQIMKQIDALDQKIGGRKELRITVDATSSFTWPWAWYLRDYKNVEYPILSNMSAPPTGQVLLLHASNLEIAKPYLTNYGPGQRFPHRWWFPEDYRGLTWGSFFGELTNPTNWGQWWAYFMNRQLSSPLGSEDAYFFVQKDLLATGAGTATQAQTQAQVPADYLTKQVTVPAIASLGRNGSGPGQFNEPKGVAVDQTGNVYVADTLNHRVQKFDPSGQLVATVGGQPGDADGQFREPWGIAVDAEGFVYVADTWNHRIQKFDSNLKFITKWGELMDSGLAPQQNGGKFYGPRAIAIAADDTLYVTDTGNKRVQHFDSNGRFLGTFGSQGSREGQFMEPVGIAIDRSGNIYVADTWNHRVQIFDPSFQYLSQFPVAGWESTGILDKPYLAVDQNGSIYVTDPENNRVLRFAPNGQLLAVINRLGIDQSSFNLPVGITLDATGNLYVADAKNHRIQKFASMP